MNGPTKLLIIAISAMVSFMLFVAIATWVTVSPDRDDRVIAAMCGVVFTIGGTAALSGLAFEHLKDWLK